MASQWETSGPNPKIQFLYNSPPPMLGGFPPNESPLHNVANPGTIVPGVGLPNLGLEYRSHDGRRWRLVRIEGSAITIGELATPIADVDEDTVSSSTDLKSITQPAASWTAGAYVGRYVYVDAGTGAGQCRRIVWNTVDTIFVERPLGLALAVATSDIVIIAPHTLEVASAGVTEIVAGVASVIAKADDLGLIGDICIAEDSYGFVQTEGFCEAVACAAAVTIDNSLTVDASAAGQANDVVNGDDLFDVRVFGFAKGVGGTGVVAPAFLNGCVM